MKKYITKFIVLSTLLVPFLCGGWAGQTASAAEEPTTATVILHKQVFENDLTGDYPKQNTGEEMPDFGGTPLAGVTFTVYDVTEKYYELGGGDTGVTQIQTDASTGVPSYAEKVTSGVTTVVTAADGTASFENLALKNGENQDMVYLFMETGAPDEIITKAAPLVIAMPLYKLTTDGKYTEEINTQIHLYPKNISATSTKELVNVADFSTVTIGETDYPNVSTGDELKYKITVQVPAMIADRTMFEVTDTPTNGLTYVPNSLTVAGLTTPGDYQLVVTDNVPGFTLQFETSSSAVQALAGKPLEITYRMKLTAEIDPDQMIENDATITFDSNPITVVGPEVYTGGYQFFKYDEHTKAGLAGAEFIVSQTIDGVIKYAQFTGTNNLYRFTGWAVEKENATTLTSGDGGQFGIVGLVNGEYTLEETKTATDKYVLLTEVLSFTVTAGSYGESVLEVANKPKGLLPSTGGKGIYLFLAIGTVLMIGAVIWYKKTNHQAEV